MRLPGLFRRRRGLHAQCPLRRARREAVLFALALLLTSVATAALGAPPVRLKDLARVRGVRENQLVGYGIVVGLNGTGDSAKSVFTLQTILTMLERLGVPIDPALRAQVAQQASRAGGGQTTVAVQNVAAVIVTATLPAFTADGDRIDVTISAIGDGKSLQGGILLRTPLTAADGQIYAVAQGPVSLGGGATASGGARGAAVHPTVGMISGGGVAEREMRSDFIEADGTVAWVLRQPDFTTAARVAAAVNARFDPPIARAISAEEIRVVLPANYVGDPVRFLARLEEIEVAPDAEARVVVNERTGTIVFGSDVRISPVAVAHGSLSVTIRAEGGEAAAVGTDRILPLEQAATVGQVVQSLNSIGATPRDVIAILQAVQRAGALHARLEVM